jgi:hypothetical protein
MGQTHRQLKHQVAAQQCKQHQGRALQSTDLFQSAAVSAVAPIEKILFMQQNVKDMRFRYSHI